MLVLMEEFMKLCALPSVIIGTHFSILKPQRAFVEDYYYHKTHGYNLMAQCVVDYNKKFIDVFVGLPGMLMI